VHGGEALPLARQVEASKLMVAQRQGAVSPLHIGTRALAHGRQPLGRVMELVLGLRAQLAQGATGLTQRGAKPLGTFPKRLASADGARLGHAIARQRWDALGVHGAGGGRRHVERIDLLPHIPRDQRDGGWHVRPHPLGLRDALHAALAEPCVLGHSANRLDVPLAICGKALAIATHTTLKSATMVVVADGAEAVCDGLALLGQALVCTAGHCEPRLGLLQAHGLLGGRPRPRFSGSSPPLCRRAWT